MNVDAQKHFDTPPPQKKQIQCKILLSHKISVQFFFLLTTLSIKVSVSGGLNNVVTFQPSGSLKTQKTKKRQ